ncbi:MAG: PilT/PilU family type 4a pilus ATPase [Pseudomonadota bacterium]
MNQPVTSAIYNYLGQMIEQKATDLYLTVGVPATLRRENGLKKISETELSDEDIDHMLAEVLTSRQRREFETNFELNIALDMGERGRFRINVLRQRQHNAMVIRRITSEIPNFAELNLPPLVEKLSMSRRGLILVTGVTSSGKSTSLASMIDYRNQHKAGHIITIEDPVEYYHAHKKSIVTQREVGIDTASYNVALKNALRQKPDVILIGEIRDAEVMEQAISAAETGHLCLATLHTNNAPQAIERIINFFPEDRQQQIRIALSLNLRAVIAQRLVNRTDDSLALALEIMLNEALIKELILKGETGKIREVMVQNASIGMKTFDQSLLDLYKSGQISEDTAVAEADIPADMRMKLRQTNYGRGENGQGDENNGSGGTSQIDTSRLSL